MSLSLDDMRRLLRKGLGGQSSTELSDSECDELLNLSLWQLEDTYPFEAKENLFSTVLVENQYEYSISDGDIGSILDALRSVAIVDDDGKRYKLSRMTRDWYDTNFDEAELGVPTRFMREGSFLILYPIPGSDEDGFQLDIFVKESIASLVEGTKETTGLPRNWDEIVVQGAIWRGHYLVEDYDLAREAQNHQTHLIRTTVPTVAKEEKDSRVAGLGVLWDWPEEHS